MQPFRLGASRLDLHQVDVVNSNTLYLEKLCGTLAAGAAGGM
ncbi:MAG: hypothetical protein ACRDUV_22910 [Pseudonocardiaceae bacterium]